ncbi:hypothetical protein DFQ30_002361, partial [Apophysomyces sp. BC1015]
MSTSSSCCADVGHAGVTAQSCNVAPRMRHAAPVIVVAPDSFKGSLSAEQVAQAIGVGIARALPDAQLRLRPMADGGEGTLDALLTRGGERRIVPVRGASGQPRQAATALLADGTAVVETAEIVGITDPVGMSAAPGARCTYGLGEAIGAMLDAGASRILVALGGSSTNDGGAGLLAALGVRFADASGARLEPTPHGLRKLAAVDVSALDPRIADVELIAMSDVNHPLTGPHGATAVFGPQKGVQPDDIDRLDRVLGHYAALLEDALGRTAHALPGAGAGGGLGYALLMLGARGSAGAELVASQIGLDDALAGADWLITGEGRSDAQTLHGKAPFVACRRATRAGVPATLLSGALDPDALPRLGKYFAGCFSPAPGPISLDAAIRN